MKGQKISEMIKKVSNIQSSSVDSITEEEFDDMFNNSYHNRNSENFIEHLSFDNANPFQNAYIVHSKINNNEQSQDKPSMLRYG